MICFCQVVPQIIWLLWFPWVTTKSRHQLARYSDGEDEHITSHRDSPEGLNEPCKSEVLQRFILLCSKVTSGGTQTQRPLCKMFFPSLLQAQTFVLHVSEGEEGKYYICYRHLQVTFAPSTIQSPEPPTTVCSHGPSVHGFEGGQNF